jgi:hypothetical protein
MKRDRPDQVDRKRKTGQRNKPDRGRERKKRQRRFERNQRAAAKERHNSKPKGKGLNVLGKDEWLKPRDLRKLKDAPDEIQFRDN